MLRCGVALFAALSFLSTACGEPNGVRIGVEFEDAEVEARTEALEVIIEEVPDLSDPCQNFQDGRNPAAERGERFVVFYPVNDSTLVVARDLSVYEQLVFKVLAFTTSNVEQAVPVAGQCLVVPIAATGAVDADFLLSNI